MSTLDKILAKSPSPEFPNGISLVQHTTEAVEVWRELRKRYSHLPMLNDDFWLRSLVAILFHDFGRFWMWKMGAANARGCRPTGVAQNVYPAVEFF